LLGLIETILDQQLKTSSAWSHQDVRSTMVTALTTMGADSKGIRNIMSPA